MSNFIWPEGPFLCPRCGAAKLSTAFYRARFTRKWADKQCRECARKAMKARYEPRIELLSNLKLERGCEDPRCVGYPPDPVVLDFDHRPGEVKELDIAASLTRWTDEVWRQRVLTEVAKCDVVCSNCHRIRTYRDREKLLGAARMTSADEAFDWPSGLHLCPGCGQEKDAKAFYRRRFTNATGVRYCRECHQRKLLERCVPRFEVLDRLRLESGCQDRRCVGHPDDPRALDFDHRPGEKKEFSIGASTVKWSYSNWLTRVTAEIAKCDVVCGNCHRIRTHRDSRPTHADYDLRGQS